MQNLRSTGQMRTSVLTWPDPLRGRDALATAGGTPALRISDDCWL